jgi:hypothetical protein
MPNYGVAQAGSNPTLGLNLTSLQSGDTDYFLFNAEVLTAPQASVAFSRANAPGAQTTYTFSIDYASAPTAVMTIQGSNTDVDADYVTLYTSTSIQHDFWTDTGAWKYYRAALVSQSGGGAVTVKVHAA